MRVKHYDEIEEQEVTKANSTNTTIRWLISKGDGSDFASTRRFEIKVGGQIGLHDHPEDHHYYVLEGKADLIDETGKKIAIRKDDVVYIPPNEKHGIINTGKGTFTFLCVIPNL